jgi:opacity protein-like surface antigen
MRLRMGLLVAALGVAAPLQAQVYLTPNVGVDFGGDTNDDSKVSYGGNLTFAGNIIGFAVDFTYAPDFFPGTLRDNNVTTLMGNLVLLTPGAARFYGSAGLGLMKTRVSDAEDLFDIDSNELGLNVGAGIIYAPSHVGFNADIRYFRQLTDPQPDGGFDIDLGSFDYWRASGGLVIRF